MSKQNLKLFNHQQEAVDMAIKNNGKLAIFAEIGLGKTRTALEIYSVLRRLDPGLKLFVVCPISLIEAAWGEDIERWTDLCWCNLRKSVEVGTGAGDIFITNYESMLTKKLNMSMFTGNWMIVLDECFDGDTLIDTPKGKRKIKNIKKGDYIINCLGKSKVLSSRIKKLDSWIKIKYNNKWIKCSLNHPFLTINGWKKAQDLKMHDILVGVRYAQKEMSILQKNLSSCHKKQTSKRKNLLCRYPETSFLQHILFSEMANGSTRNSIKNLQRQSQQKNFIKIKKMVGFISSRCYKTNRENTQSLPIKRSKSKKKNISKIKTYQVETNSPRWKWTAPAYSTKQIIKIIGKNVGSRICSAYKCKKRPWFFDQLQNRYCISIPKNRNRSRWIQSLCKKKIRYKKGQTFDFARVEDIKIYKQRSNDESRKSIKQNIFYDLEIENHPSFSVNDVLVHNSSKLKNPKAQITKKLLSIKHIFKHRVIMSGTPAPNGEWEYWAQMNFIRPGIFHERFGPFKNYYFHLERKGGLERFQGQIMTKDMARRMFTQGWKYAITPKRKEELLKRLLPHCHYAKKKDCLDLPDQIDEVRKIELPPKLRRYYEDMKKDLIIEIKNTYVTAQTALTKILKLREICSGFGIGEDRKILELGENPKLRELLTLLEEIGNQQAIIWTNFVYETEKIQSVLGDKAISIYGKTIDKYQCINDFKQGRYQYLIANMQSLAHGITLTNCSIQIFFSLSYSYEQYIQSRGRTHRISQENKCTYIHLLCKDSIDEVVYKVLQKKGKAIEILENILTR